METNITQQVSLSCCPHVLKYLELSVGDVRKMSVQIGDASWQFEKARIAPKESCDCKAPWPEPFIGVDTIDITGYVREQTPEARQVIDEFMQRYQVPGGKEITITGEYDT